MSSEMIKVSTVNKEVYDLLRFKISTGEIPPGERITLRTIAEEFGVSTMPVREAVRRLQAEGLLYFENRNVIIRQLSLEEVKQIFVIRGRLETLAIEWALPNVTEEDLFVLRKHLEKMDKQGLSFNDWEVLNRQFHLQLYHLSGSAPLQNLIKNVWDSVTPYMYIYSSSVTSFEHSQSQHYRMLDFIGAKNTEQLLHLLLEHLNDTSAIILQSLESQFCQNFKNNG
jgi:DNA-binding GntR family transcriptional regulator